MSSKSALNGLLIAMVLVVLSGVTACDRFQQESAMPTTPEPMGKQAEGNFVEYDEPPMPIGGFEALQKALTYPEAARRAGIQGRAIINALISASGTVDSVRVLKSTGDASLDEAAMAAVRKVAWNPAKRQGQPLSVWVAMPVVFKLDESGNPVLEKAASESIPPHERPIRELTSVLNKQYSQSAAPGITGSVILDVAIAPDGEVLKKDVDLHSRPHPALRDLAMKAVDKVRFVPLEKNGKPVPTRYRIEFRYLEDSAYAKLLKVTAIQ